MRAWWDLADRPMRCRLSLHSPFTRIARVGADDPFTKECERCRYTWGVGWRYAALARIMHKRLAPYTYTDSWLARRWPGWYRWARRFSPRRY